MDLMNKKGYPNSINHFENKRAPEHRRMETVFSVIMNLSKRSMELCIGKADPQHYEPYRLQSHFEYKDVIKRENMTQIRALTKGFSDRRCNTL